MDTLDPDIQGLTTQYRVRIPDENGGPYGPYLHFVYGMKAATRVAEEVAGDTNDIVYVDRYTLVKETLTDPDTGQRHVIESWELDDGFYAEVFEGQWTVEGRT